MTTKHGTRRSPTILVVSGGVGASAQNLVHTALAQFPGAHADVDVVPRVTRTEQLEAAVQQATEEGALLVHTLVSSTLRREIETLAGRRGTPAVDLMGGLLENLSELLKRKPVEEPGRYRELHREHFGRVDAIEFAVEHDDGVRPEDWHKADVLLLGASRAGKTPTSVVLAVRGWKAANSPLVPGIPMPDELFEVDRRRIVGLTIGADQLAEHRRFRRQQLGKHETLDRYVDPAALVEEVAAVRRFYQSHGIAVVDTTKKPVEEVAEEVIAEVSRWRT